MSSFMTSEIGLPVQTNYSSVAASLDNQSYVKFVSQSPNGPTSVVGSAISSTVFVANAPGFVSQQFNNTQLIFDIPSASPAEYIDTSETNLQFKLTVVVGTASSGTATKVRLIGGAHSFIDSIQLLQNNVALETISSYGQLYTMILNASISYSERTGCFGGFAGTDSNSASGLEMAHAATGTYYYSFTIPILSIIGLSTTDRFFPVGLCQNLQLAVNTASALPWTSSCTAITTQPVYTSITLSEFFLNLKYVVIPSSVGALMQSAKNGKIYLKTNSWQNNNVGIASGSQGLQQLLLQLRVSSMKNLLWYEAISATASCPNGNFDACDNGGVNRLQVNVNGLLYPNRELNHVNYPSQCLYYFLQALGMKFDLSSYGGTIGRSAYGAVIPSLPSGADNALVVPATMTRAAPIGSDEGSAAIIDFPNQVYFGVDLSKIDSNMFCGMNTKSQPPVIVQNKTVATTSAALLYAWCNMDLLLEFDIQTKQVIAYI